VARPLPEDVRFAGPMQPWLMEGVIDDCVISQGEVPRELRGGYYRNGPNMKRPTKQGGRDGRVSIVEPQFAPRSADAPEGDGYIIAPVTRVEERRTDVLIFDTDAIDEGPVATVWLPHQTPWTPHGCWMAFDD
jgi:carotenoid cleavage dioxygenase-like enzyme